MGGSSYASLDKFWIGETENGITTKRELSRIQMSILHVIQLDIHTMTKGFHLLKQRGL